MATKLTREPRLNRDAWLDRALDVLRDEGIQGVRVERLARDLGVTKGSFYWHFKNLDDLRQSILDYWKECYNDTIIENRDFLDAEPAAGLLAAVTKVREGGLDAYEIAFRSWADHDPRADEVVRSVYEKRTKFMRSFFTRLGFRGSEAEIRARIILCYLSWEPSMYPDESETRRINLLQLLHELLVS